MSPISETVMLDTIHTHILQTVTNSLILWTNRKSDGHLLLEWKGGHEDGLEEFLCCDSHEFMTKSEVHFEIVSSH